MPDAPDSAAHPVAVRPSPGQPRSAADAAFLAKFNARMRLPIILSALLPLLVAPADTAGSPGAVNIVVGVGSWIVFVIDFVAQQRHVERNLRTVLGWFDLSIVVLTAPWFLLPGASSGSWVVVLRLARLVRVLMVTRGARRLVQRLGSVLIVAIGVIIVGALIAYPAEHPVNPEFAKLADAFWWAIVTLTTVGYGDVVPITKTGRLAGIFIMTTGVAVLGVLAGSLASFLRIEGNDDSDAPATGDAATPADPPAPPAPALDALVDEVAQLRIQVALLVSRLGGGSADPPASG